MLRLTASIFGPGVFPAVLLLILAFLPGTVRDGGGVIFCCKHRCCMAMSIRADVAAVTANTTPIDVPSLSAIK